MRNPPRNYRCLPLNHIAFLIGNILAHTSPTERLMSTLSGGPKILEHLLSLRMIRMYLLGKLLIWLALGLVGTAEVGNIGIMRVTTLEREKG